MEKGTIPKILDYYFGKPQFKKEILRALRQFFNRPDLGPGKQLELQDENEEAMFNEWFVFDFKLSNGKTPLQDFYEENPYNLNRVRLQVYKDLQDNHFGLYKVKDVRRGAGLSLENLQTGKVYQVREFSATFGLSKGQVFSTRVGKVGDHYELVGSNPSFGPVKLDATLEKLFRKEKKELNLKVFKDSFLGEKGFSDFLEDYPCPEEAEANLNKVLMKYNLDQFVSIPIIKEWIYNHSGDDPINFVNMLCSLLYLDMKNYGKALTEILNSFNVFYNLHPQKGLEGKSPFQKIEEQEEKGIPADLKISCTKFSPLDWGKKYTKALKHMEQAQFKQALKKLDQVFAYLLKHKITYPEIYRVYANKGVCHFVLKEKEIGEVMLKIAVELNPFYDFAKRQLKEFKDRGLIRAKKTKKEQITIQRISEHDIGYQYYKFLEPYKINFAQRG